jgi:hypothetical protein
MTDWIVRPLTGNANAKSAQAPFAHTNFTFQTASPSLRGALATKQSIYPRKERRDCFRLRSLSYGGHVVARAPRNDDDYKRTFAISRRNSPELCNLPPRRGRGERRMPAAPAASCALLHW